MNFHHVPPSRTHRLSLTGGHLCPTHQNSPSSFFTSRASRHSVGSASQRGQLERWGCEGWGWDSAPHHIPRSIPPVAPGPGPFHTAPWVPQPQQPHLGEAQRHLRAASSVGLAPRYLMPAHPWGMLTLCVPVTEYACPFTSPSSVRYSPRSLWVEDRGQ